MRITFSALSAFLVSVALLGTGCSTKGPGTASIDPVKLKMFAPLPAEVASPSNPITLEKVNLGRMLYYEARLSKSQTISCNTCHQLEKYGVDGEPTSSGHKGQHGDRNSPTVLNAAAHFVQFWDGRAPDVEAQAKGPVLNPVEMAMLDDKSVVKVLKSMPEYTKAFKAAFPGDKDPVTFDNMAKAIGVYERKLMTPSRWDKFLQGDQSALTPEEKAGFVAFTEAGCQTCHAGTLVGGNLYQKLGAAKPWPDGSDPGRYKVTKSEGDKLVFKVPSLRNVEKTGPYFHNGKVTTLDEAIDSMAQYQLGKKLAEPEVKAIATWLKTLTAEPPADLIGKPVLPESTKTTPKPDTAG